MPEGLKRFTEKFTTRRGRKELPAVKRLTVHADLTQEAKTNHNNQPSSGNKW